MRALGRLLLIAAAALAASAAAAGPILDRVKAGRVLRCGGVERPGLVVLSGDGEAHGLELDLCRAVASVVLGAEGRIEFTRYDSEQAFAAARAGHDDLMFLTGREMVENGLAAQVIPGPAIFIETTSAIVQADAPYQHLQELAGKPICFALGPHAQYHLQAWFAARHLSFIPMAFQEDVEMNDAYKVRYCHALAGETTTLAETAHSPEMAKTRHRFLPETLAAYPILADEFDERRRIRGDRRLELGDAATRRRAGQPMGARRLRQPAGRGARARPRQGLAGEAGRVDGQLSATLREEPRGDRRPGAAARLQSRLDGRRRLRSAACRLNWPNRL